MAEVATGLSLVAGSITILRTIAELLNRFKKKKEAKALEKAADAIESSGETSPSQAKETLERTLTRELGKDKARPLVEYTEIVETLFPFRPFWKEKPK